ncbi:hypothetical protein DASB73_019630 [Starmerella bacillaris]|uniref:RRM domain-containing protein n=1 Tax=Starmerella bacillaris TaxID=1247836 RepID=A0AAV5RHT1_STABA|nr:hypothetical protein DASB73_019630 [Starmerella bacillaris]
MVFIDFREEKGTHVNLHSDSAIYVSGLKQGTTVQQITDVFERFGVIEAILHSKSQSESSYYALIKYTCFEEAQNALKKRRRLIVNKKQVIVKQSYTEKQSNKIFFSNNCEYLNSKYSNASTQEKQDISGGRTSTVRFAGHPTVISFDEDVKCDSLNNSTTNFCDLVDHSLSSNELFDTDMTKSNSTSNDTCNNTMGYGPNGNLLLIERGPLFHESISHNASDFINQGDKEAYDSSVIRIDGLPFDWTARSLFNHISSLGIPVVAAMVYNDIDDRKLRQGLLQMESNESAEDFVRKGYLQTPVLKLNVLSSAIQSIGRVRKTYAGNYTVYSKLDEKEDEKEMNIKMRKCSSPRNPWHISEKDVHQDLLDLSLPEISPTLVSEPLSPIPIHMNSSKKLPAYSYRFDNPNDAMIIPSPDSVNSGYGAVSQSPIKVTTVSKQCTKNMNSKTHCHDIHGKTSSAFSSSPASTYTESPIPYTAYTYNSKLNVNLMQPNAAALSELFHEIPMHHRPSQTIIVENFDKNLVSDAQVLASALSKYGTVTSCDIVPINEQVVKAYVRFDTPSSAGYALGQLSVCASGPYPLKVKLA